MKTATTLLLALALAGGERERGLQAYREGRFAEAAAAFRAAIAQDGDSPELQWNLALASWRAGELDAAETAAEKYAAASGDARVDLHAGLLGAVRHDEARALEAQADAAPPAGGAAAGGAPVDPLPLLEQALAKATQARDHFVRGAAANATPELLRNTERALRTIDALQRRIDELKKQREQQQKEQDEKKKDDDKQKDDDKKDDKEKQDEPKQQPKPDDEKQDQPKPSPEKPEQQKPDDGKSDPKPQQGQQGEGDDPPEPQAPPEPKDGKGDKPPSADKAQPGEPKPQPASEQPEPKAGEARNDAPGEGAEGHVLSPEQTQRLLEQLRELDDKQKAIRLRMKAARKPVERDW